MLWQNIIEKFNVQCHFNSLIDPPAVLPDLSAGPGEGLDVAHPDHRGYEVRAEGGGAAAVGADERVRGAAVEELLVRVKEATLLDEVLVVVVVEVGR